MREQWRFNKCSSSGCSIRHNRLQLPGKQSSLFLPSSRNLSAFDSSGFQQLPSGEFFSSSPPRPQSQQRVEDPLALIGQHFTIKFVPNLIAFIKELQNSGIQVNGENIDK
jgi:hypothetical protein